jgi:hypothetical protein
MKWWVLVWMIGFISTLVTIFLITLNYNTVTILHTLQSLHTNLLFPIIIFEHPVTLIYIKYIKYTIL